MDDESAGRPRPPLSRGVWIASAAVTALVAFGIGFGAAVIDDDGSGPPEVAAPAPTTTTTVPPAPTIGATVPPTTVSPPPTSIEETTTRPPPSTAPPATTRVLPSPSPAPAPTPAAMTVQYPRDASGRLVMTAGSVARLTITNQGGSLGQWLVQSTGPVTPVGTTTGTLEPGRTIRVAVRAAPEVGPSAQAVLRVTVTGRGVIQIPVHIV